MVTANLRPLGLCMMSLLFLPGVAQGQFYFPAQASASASSAAQVYTPITPTAPAYGVTGARYFAPPQSTRLSMNTDTAVSSMPAPEAAGDSEVIDSSLAPYDESADCNDCTSCTVCAPRRCCPWYVSAAGLVMGRNSPNGVWTSYETGNNPNQLTKTPDAESDWRGGGDIRIGRFFGCSRWALEFGFWGIDNYSDTQTTTHASTVSSPLLFQDLEFGVGNPVQTWFDVADVHRLSRHNDIYNFELNMIQGFLPNARCQNCTGRAMIGIRYFEFDEDLSFETLDQGGTFGGNGGLDEATLSDAVENSMIGVQVGYLLEHRIGCRLNAFITPKIGIYNNHIKNNFQLVRGDGTVASPTAASGAPGNYPVNTSKDIVSFLTEVDLGLRYQLTQRWSLFGGYRVVIINGVGLSDNQIPQYIVDVPEIADIDTNGSLVLQGAFFGAGFNF
jgi:hypothetical protein